MVRKQTQRGVLDTMAVERCPIATRVHINEMRKVDVEVEMVATARLGKCQGGMREDVQECVMIHVALLDI